MIGMKRGLNSVSMVVGVMGKRVNASYAPSAGFFITTGISSLRIASIVIMGAVSKGEDMHLISGAGERKLEELGEFFLRSLREIRFRVSGRDFSTFLPNPPRGRVLIEWPDIPVLPGIFMELFCV